MRPLALAGLAGLPLFADARLAGAQGRVTVALRDVAVREGDAVRAGQPDAASRTSLPWEGEWEVTRITSRNMGAALAVALLAICVLVVAHLRSFLAPLIVLVPVPLTLLGVVLGDALMATPSTAAAATIGAGFILADPIFRGLAVSLLFGLLSSTALTVLVIPAAYRVLRDPT